MLNILCLLANRRPTAAAPAAPNASLLPTSFHITHTPLVTQGADNVPRQNLTASLSPRQLEKRSVCSPPLVLLRIEHQTEEEEPLALRS